jgi:uroporphyrinogen-III synthase
MAEALVTAERLRAMGYDAIVAPLLEVQMVSVGAVDGFDGVVATSGNALAALSCCTGLPLLAVGDATAARARAAGFRQVFSAGGDAATLARVAPTHFRVGGRLLFVTAEGEGLGLAEALRQAGFQVDRRVGYTVRPASSLPGAAREALVSGRLRAALFLSARTARVFASLLDPVLYRHLGAVDALAIGRPAADELTPLPWRRVRVSLSPTLDQVLALL